MKINLFKTLKIYKNIFSKDENGREINIYKIKNLTVTGHNIYYPNVLLKTDNNLILPILERTMSLKSGTIYERNNMTFNCCKKKIDHIITDPLFFFVYNTDNYFHFLYDTLPYLISYFELKKEIPNLKLLMQYPNPQKKEMYKFVIEFLKILDINNNDIIIINEYTKYNKIYISTSYTHDIDSNLPPRKEIFDFYKKMVKIVHDNNPLIKSHTKIYISRRTWLHNDFSNIGTNYTTRRKLVNEDKLVKKLVSDGYEEIWTEQLSTTQKILLFSNATHIVGAIGGGIANVLFCPKSVYLKAIISPSFLDVNKRFKYCLDNVNVYYDQNTKHVEQTKFKTYMRIKTKDNKIVGEIEKIYDDKLLVSYTDGSNTGWNAQNKYNKIELFFNEIQPLDNGLNSPWVYLFDNQTN
jgi:hypothetical protein